MAANFLDDINFVEIQEKIQDGVYSVGNTLRKSRSEIWNTVLCVYDENKTAVMGIVYCPICRKVLKYSTLTGTSSVLWHIKRCKEISVVADTANVNQTEQNGTT